MREPLRPPLVGEGSFRELLLAETRFIDVRSEVEFARGSVPGAINLPILNTRERELVGRCYKERGPDQAIALGHELVGGDLREARTQAWLEVARNRPGTHVFCWRGGMRSGLAARWMAESGLEVPVIDGGYKALRRYLMAAIRDAARERPLVVIGGRTGAGKTALLKGLPGAVDLEGHARHRGSSFGRRVQAPPSQIDFEHALALELLRRPPEAAAPVFLEDESRRVGAVSVPLELFRAMGRAPLVIVEAPWADRVGRILQEYVIDLRRDYEAQDPVQGFSQYSAHLLGSLDRIRKRLGGDRHRRLRAEMEAALEAQLAGSPSRHEAWIGELLTAYYDPMYEYQLSGVQERVCFRGSWATAREWCLARA